MKIILNGQPLTLENSVSITELLIDQGYDGKVVAVAINNNFVPKSSYPEQQIQGNDRVEIVAPMQGG